MDAFKSHNLNKLPFNGPKALRLLMGHVQKMVAKFRAISLRFNTKFNPVFIYQMGKVGSSSVYKTLKALGLRQPIFFVHFLSNDLYYYKHFLVKAGMVPVSYHIELGIALRRIILGHRNNLRYKIISMVRDPIGRQISDVFQNPEIMGMDIRNQEGMIDKNKAMALIRDKFSDLKTFDYVFEWFDRELKSVFGIDVFSKPFNRDSGWTIYNGEHADALVIRMEDLSAVGESVISEFLNIPHKITLYQSNVRSQTPEAKAYNYVKNTVKVNEEKCKKIYDSRFVRHFYSDKQIETMIEKWAK